MHKRARREAAAVSGCKKLSCVQFSLGYTSLPRSPSSIHLFIAAASSAHEPAAIHSSSSSFLPAERKKTPQWCTWLSTRHAQPNEHADRSREEAELLIQPANMSKRLQE